MKSVRQIIGDQMYTRFVIPILMQYCITATRLTLTKMIFETIMTVAESLVNWSANSAMIFTMNGSSTTRTKTVTIVLMESYQIIFKYE